MAIALSATYASTIILPGGDNLMCLRGIKCETDIDEPIVSSDDWDDTNECFVVLLERKMKVRGEMVEGCKVLVALVPETPPIVPSIDPRVVNSDEFIRWRRLKNASENGIGQPPPEQPPLFLRGAINPG